MALLPFGEMDPKDHWRDVCAPLLKARKAELGRKLPEREIAAYVEANTGKPSQQTLINHWLTGRREPFVSQFLALCTKLEVDPLGVLRGELLVVSPVNQRLASTRRFTQLVRNEQESLGKSGKMDKPKAKKRG